MAGLGRRRGIDPKVMEFISTFPEYLDKHNDGDINATPRSYERISDLYKLYTQQGDVPRPYSSTSSAAT